MLKKQLLAEFGACLFGFVCCFSIAGCEDGNTASAIPVPQAQPSEYKARSAAADQAGPAPSASKKEDGVMSRRRAAGSR